MLNASVKGGLSQAVITLVAMRAAALFEACEEKMSRFNIRNEVDCAQVLISGVAGLRIVVQIIQKVQEEKSAVCLSIDLNVRTRVRLIRRVRGISVDDYHRILGNEISNVYVNRSLRRLSDSETPDNFDDFLGDNSQALMRGDEFHLNSQSCGCDSIGASGVSQLEQVSQRLCLR